jgi:hypothetical protein
MEPITIAVALKRPSPCTRCGWADGDFAGAAEVSCVAVRIATFKFVLQENIHSRHLFLEMRRFDFSHWPEYLLEYTDSSDADLYQEI